MSTRGADTSAPAEPDGGEEERPLYPRLLRLRHVHPTGWQRAVFVEGSLLVAGLLVLADVATAWTLLVLPVVVALVVKANDVLAGLLTKEEVPPAGPAEGEGVAPEASAAELGGALGDG